jgi:hypothetical protein
MLQDQLVGLPEMGDASYMDIEWPHAHSVGTLNAMGKSARANTRESISSLSLRDNKKPFEHTVHASAPGMRLRIS